LEGIHSGSKLFGIGFQTKIITYKEVNVCPDGKDKFPLLEIFLFNCSNIIFKI